MRVTEVDSQELTFWEHVSVLRTYILFGGIFFFCSAIAVFVYGETLLTSYILRPLQGQPLVFLSPLGPFLFTIKIALLGALVISLPVWLLLISHFVGEALSPDKRLRSLLFVIAGAFLGAASLAVTYWYLVPVSLVAISHFVVPGTSLMITADSYIGFFLFCAITTFVVFELPLAIIFLSYIGLINPHSLIRRRRMIYIGILVLMAILTPTTDPVTLIIVTVPAIALLEVGLAVSKRMYTFSAD